MMCRKLVNPLLLLCLLLPACADKPAAENAPPAAADRLDWFRQARFGMFIHWGLYAVPAGEWDGKTDYGEWIQYSANIPGAEYEKLARQFNPVKFDAAEWVSAAKGAGMKYMVITAKHHEGFCLYDSALTDYDIVDASPYGRDPMKELAAECARQGLKFCFYYSVQDWHHPDYPTLYTRRTKAHPDGFHGFPNDDADFMRYLDYLEGQVRELLTNYGPVGTLFFDWYGDAFESSAEIERGQQIVDMIHELQPETLINNRFGGIGADYGTPEQQIPGGHQSTAFEVCMTLNRHWGYNKRDHDWKDARTVVFNLCDIASKGGNYLLNVGPTAEGLFPEESTRILAEVGQWLEKNGEAIYGADPGPDMRWEQNIAMMTTRPGKYYLHIFDWPKDQRLFYFDFRHQLKKAYLLADPSKRELEVDTYRRSLTVHLPEKAPDPINSILVLEYE